MVPNICELLQKVILTLEEWRHLLEGASVPFLVWTDLQNLKYLCPMMRLWFHPHLPPWVEECESWHAFPHPLFISRLLWTCHYLAPWSPGHRNMVLCGQLRLGGTPRLPCTSWHAVQPVVLSKGRGLQGPVMGSFISSRLPSWGCPHLCSPTA